MDDDSGVAHVCMVDTRKMSLEGAIKRGKARQSGSPTAPINLPCPRKLYHLL